MGFDESIPASLHSIQYSSVSAHTGGYFILEKKKQISVRISWKYKLFLPIINILLVSAKFSHTTP